MNRYTPTLQCRGSVTFWCGSGSLDPYLWLMNPDWDPTPDPTPFFFDFKDCSPLNTFTIKGKDPDLYLWIMDPDPGGPKTCGSGSESGFPTLPPSVADSRCLLVFLTKKLLQSLRKYYPKCLSWIPGPRIPDLDYFFHPVSWIQDQTALDPWSGSATLSLPSRFLRPQLTQIHGPDTFNLGILLRRLYFGSQGNCLVWQICVFVLCKKNLPTYQSEIDT